MDLDAPPLTDIPGQLRQVADEIERGDRLLGGGHVVLILDAKDGAFGLLAFGEVESGLVAASLNAASLLLARKRLDAQP